MDEACSRLPLRQVAAPVTLSQLPSLPTMSATAREESVFVSIDSGFSRAVDFAAKRWWFFLSVDGQWLRGPS